jgi:acetylornithine deacetylase/succinyl-diaminopimelate desuccinylase-like protein
VSEAPAEVTDLLQQLIRNACVNDGTKESGGESRNADLLRSYLEGAGLDFQSFEPVPGRASLVTRIEGSDPTAPTLLLMGHTDVVPVNPDGWSRDPFGGELVDGIVWGRGAVDMLNLTSSMAVAFKRLARSGFKPRGTLAYLAVADEEAQGVWGAKWLVENELDAVRADYVLTEFGGFRFPSPPAQGLKLPVSVAEKGTYWCTLRVRGTPGHASMPFRSDNALVKAAKVVTRLAEFWPPEEIHETWQRFVTGLGLPAELTEPLLDPGRIHALCDGLPDDLAKLVHAQTHMTMAPTIMHAGVKTNVIPDTAELQIDVRILPGQTGQDVQKVFNEALGDLAGEVDITEQADDNPATASPMDTPLWDVLQRVAGRLVPGATNVPFMINGATDARFFRRVGAVGYGYGLFSDRISWADFGGMFHGDDERVDQESLRLTTELWEAVAQELLG